jgi:lysophospholipase L1-like esterase
LTELFTDQPELIIIAIGENVSDLATPEKQAEFRESFQKLLQFAKTHSNATIIVRSCFWANEIKDRIMQEQSQAADIMFVDIGNLGADPRNRASAERDFTHAGVAGHPGDRGMAAIADALWMALQKSTKATVNK